MTVASGMPPIRAARRYRWRLAGGHLIASESGLRFAPNRLERWRADTGWKCSSKEVVAVRVRGKMWLVVETTTTIETFRIFRVASLTPALKATLRVTAAPI
jgi:hypothetical protein